MLDFALVGDFFLLRRVQTETGVHTAQYSVGNSDCLFEDRAAGALS